MFEPRTYRALMESARFGSFTVVHRESDLWIGVDRPSFSREMPDVSLRKIRDLRETVDRYADEDSLFLGSLVPYESNVEKPPVVCKMFGFAHKADVGPMASVAGVFAQEIGESLMQAFDIQEIVVENGGDIFLFVRSEVHVAVFAGDSPFSQRVGLTIDPVCMPLGICTSSGTVGHSLSFGKADAVMIVSREAGLADAYATSFCNRIQNGDDLDPVLEAIGMKEDIEGAMIVINDRLGVRGRFPMRTFEYPQGKDRTL